MAQPKPRPFKEMQNQSYHQYGWSSLNSLEEISLLSS